jgi:hypothetical protein
MNALQSPHHCTAKSPSLQCKVTSYKMSDPHTLPSLKHAAADSNQAYRPGYALSHQMSSEIRLLAAVVVLIFLVAIILPTGKWLDLALYYQAYHIDDIIVGVFAVSLVLMIFLIRGWRELRYERSERALVVTQIEQRAYINGQLSQMTRLLQLFLPQKFAIIPTHPAWK